MFIFFVKNIFIKSAIEDEMKPSCRSKLSWKESKPLIDKDVDKKVIDQYIIVLALSTLPMDGTISYLYRHRRIQSQKA